jgi:acyl-coenzyme A thioesterase PaaI-like protein
VEAKVFRRNEVDSSLRDVCHPACIVCASRDEGGLGVRFRKQPDGSVVGIFDCEERFQGYPDRLHGGVVALLLDAAMTHCLFHNGIVGVTGRLQVSFRGPVDLGRRAQLHARIESHVKKLYRLKAELVQDARAKATAEAKFLADPKTLRPGNGAHPAT